MKQKPGFVLWLTGLSGAGKTTLAHEVEAIMHRLHLPVQALDGDTVRSTLCKDLSFSTEDRRENIRRVSWVTQLLAGHGIKVIVSFISPLAQMREEAAGLVQQSGARFIEVYVNASLEECEKRDPKGLYKKARAGEIPDFTGITQDYEAPVNPSITCFTDRESIEQSTKKIMEYLINNNIV